MQLFRGLGNLPHNLQGCTLTIGNFDGVHFRASGDFAPFTSKSGRAELAYGGYVV